MRRHLLFVLCLLGAALVAAGMLTAGHRLPNPGLVRHPSAEAVGSRGQLTGSVEGVDIQTGTLRVAGGMFGLAISDVSVGADTSVHVTGKIGVLDDLRPGTRVLVCYEMRATGRWARIIEAPPPRAACDFGNEPPVTNASSPGPATRAGSPRADHEPAATRHAEAPASATAPAEPTEPAASIPNQRATRRRAAPGGAVTAPPPVAPPRATSVDGSRGRRAEPGTPAADDFGAVIDWMLRK